MGRYRGRGSGRYRGRCMAMPGLSAAPHRVEPSLLEPSGVRLEMGLGLSLGLGGGGLLPDLTLDFVYHY